MSIMDELYYGEINPSQDCVPSDSNYKYVCKKKLDEMKLLKEKISNEDYKRVEEIEGLCSTMGSSQSKKGFYEGFRLGMLLMVDVLYGRNG